MKQLYYIVRKVCFMLLLAALGSCAQNSQNIFPLEQVYLNPQSLASSLTALLRDHSDLCSLHLLGFSSIEGIPIQALKIGSGAQKALVIGQHHGDEVLGVEVAMQIATELLDGSELSRRLLQHYEVWIVPTLNPEGWRIVRSGVYQWKRKNNRDTTGNGNLDVRDDGVDLNRNYPVFWELDKLVSVSDPFFKGSAPASEAETQAIIALAELVRFELAVFYHSSSTGMYSEKIFMPAYDRADAAQSAAMEELSQIVELYSSQVQKDYSKEAYDVPRGMSSKVGNARNYFFHTYGTKAFLVEIGGKNQTGSAIVHPPARIMQQNRLQHSRAFLNLLYNSISSPGGEGAQ